MTDPAPETGPSEEAQPAQPKRFLFLRRRDVVETPAPGSPAPSDAVDAAAEDPGERVRPGVLRRRRRALEGVYQQAIFDLGGLAMELHSRGLLAEDVMRRKAAEVTDIRQQLDELGARLDELRDERKERRQAGRRPAITCPACGARCAAGANFCASCGAPLAPAATDGDHGEGEGGDAGGDAGGEEQVTTVIEETVVVEQDVQPTQAIPPVPRDGD